MEDKHYKDQLFYTITKPLLIFLIYVLFHPTVVGRENIPKKGPVVFAGNHTKWIDPEMICAVIRKRQVHFLAKIELYKNIFTKIICLGMGAIPVDRKAHDGNALKYAIRALNDGLSIGIFPEGTINRTNDIIMPFKIGAVKMAKEGDAPIVPFVITGKYRLFRKGIKVEFLKPIRITDELDKENKRLMKIISNKLEGEMKNERKS